MIIGKIYKIVDKRESRKILYIGSTQSKYLCQRRGSHKECSFYRNSKFYTHGREQGFDNFKLVQIAKVECETLEELREREEAYRKQFTPPLNERRAYLTTEEKAQLIIDCNARGLAPVLCDCGKYTSTRHIERHKGNSVHKKRMFNLRARSCSGSPQ